MPRKKKVKVDADAVAAGDALNPIRIGSRGQSVYEPSFGGSIGLSDYKWLEEREPVASRITRGVAKDIFGAWFKLKPRNEKIKAEDFDYAIQSKLRSLKFKEKIMQACHFTRRDGFSFLILGLSDGGTETEASENSKLLDLEVYPAADYIEDSSAIDRNPDSPRFGLPVTYTFNRGFQQRLKMHFTRVIVVATHFSDDKWRGESELKQVWDDITLYRAIRYGASQGMVRWGTGIPTLIGPAGVKKNKLDTIIQEQIGNPNSRTWFALGSGWEIEFKGIGGVALNPKQYEEIMLKNIAMGTSIPVPILEGATVGYVTSSEINERQYFKMVSNQQVLYEPFIRQVIKYVLNEYPQFRGVEYSIEWNTPFKLTETQRARAERLIAQANELTLEFMTINEVRQRAGLPPVDGGDVILSLERLKAAALGQLSQETRGRRGNVPEEKKP